MELAITQKKKFTIQGTMEYDVQQKKQKTKNLNPNIGKKMKLVVMQKKKVDHLRNNGMQHVIKRTKNQKFKPEHQKKIKAC